MGMLIVNLTAHADDTLRLDDLAAYAERARRMGLSWEDVEDDLEEDLLRRGLDVPVNVAHDEMDEPLLMVGEAPEDVREHA